MTARRLVVKLHLYIGLFVGLLLVVTGLSGSVLVYREELEALAHPHLLVSDGAGERVAVADVVAAVQRAYPADKPFAIRMPHAPHETYLVKLNSAHDRFVYVDPYSGGILGSHRQNESALGWLSLLHTELLAGEAGETALGIGGLLLLGLGATGVVLWWPRNRKLSQGFKVRWSAHWKRLNFDLHRASGIYAAVFLLATAFTGAALVFDKSFAGLINAMTGSLPRAALPLSIDPVAGAPALPLDLLLHRADRVWPATTTWINLPQTPQMPVTIRKKLAQESHPNGRSFVYLDQYTGRILGVENALTAPLGTRIFNTFYPIHIGVIGGMPTRVVQIALGLMPAILFMTGFVMWKNRRKGKRAYGRQRGAVRTC